MTDTPNYRLAMLDVDGTLRDEEGWKPLSQVLIGAVADAGLEVALCSGRNTESLQGLAVGRPQIRFLSAGSGSLVLTRDGDAWTALASRFISRDTVGWICEQAEEVGMELWAYTDHAWLVGNRNERVKAESHMVGAQATVSSFADRDDIVKLMAFPLSRDHRATLNRVDAQRDLAVVQSYPGYFDIVDAQAASAKGGDVLVEHLELTWPQVIAMGDGENDLGMLSKAGVAMAMAPLRTVLLQLAEPGQQRFDCPDLAAVLDRLGALGVIEAA